MYVSMFRNFVNFTNKYRILRGMISYGVLWPCGCLIEQTMVEKRTFRTYDWMKCLRFGIYGFFIIGPSIYAWIRLASIMWPRTDIKSSLCKALTEQVAFDPMAITSFLFLMTLMEGNSTAQARQEVSDKFFDAYKVGVVYWPIVQTVNFAFVPLRNQVVFTSFFSMCWTTFLAYVKFLQLHPPVDVDHHAVDIHFLEM